jgi:hypothetical protein
MVDELVCPRTPHPHSNVTASLIVRGCLRDPPPASRLGGQGAASCRRPGGLRRTHRPGFGRRVGSPSLRPAGWQAIDGGALIEVALPRPGARTHPLATSMRRVAVRLGG